MEEALYYKEDSDSIYIKAQGHITAALCTDLKIRVFERLDSGIAPKEIYLDLEFCEYMDSTFMGLIVGMNKRFQKLAGKPVSILGLNESCSELLNNIGVLKLLNASVDKVPFPVPMENMCQSQKATAEFLLDVHENLIELSDENKKRFQVLQTVLKGQIDSEKKE